MRVMVIVKGNPEAESGQIPDGDLFEKMNAYNQALVDAGVMLAGDGLHPSDKGKRVCFGDQGVEVVDGPFEPAHELVSGYWLWSVRDMDDALQWVKKAPFGGGQVLELRPLFEIEDFGDAMGDELKASENQMRATLEGRRAVN